jgi:hypothetical protein
MDGLSKAYFKYATISEQFEEDTIVLAHRKVVEAQLKGLESTLHLQMDAATPQSASNRMSL